MIVITTPTGLIGHQILDNGLDNAEPRTPQSTTLTTSFCQWYENVLKPAVIA